MVLDEITGLGRGFAIFTNQFVSNKKNQDQRSQVEYPLKSFKKSIFIKFC